MLVLVNKNQIKKTSGTDEAFYLLKIASQNITYTNEAVVLRVRKVGSVENWSRTFRIYNNFVKTKEVILFVLQTGFSQIRC